MVKIGEARYLRSARGRPVQEGCPAAAASAGGGAATTFYSWQDGVGRKFSEATAREEEEGPGRG